MKIVLSLGSNEGDKEANINKALELLDLKNPKVSEGFHNKALLPKNAPKEWDMEFINICISAETDKTAQETLQQIHKIEDKLERNRTRGIWSPRTVDIDIIYYGNEIIKEAHLQVPHKLMHKRDFVLIPLQEIEPDFIHPIFKLTTKELLASLD